MKKSIKFQETVLNSIIRSLNACFIMIINDLPVINAEHKKENKLLILINQHLKTRIQSFKTMFQGLKIRFESLKTRIQRFKTMFQGLKLMFGSLKIRIQSFKTMFQGLKIRFGSLKTRIQSFKTMFQGLKIRFGSRKIRVQNRIYRFRDKFEGVHALDITIQGKG